MGSMERMIALVEGIQGESFNRPHGIICSEKTARLLKDKLESIGEDGATSIIYGIPICAEKLFIEDKLWILNEELWDIYCKDGLVGLIRHMAKSIKRRKK